MSAEAHGGHDNHVDHGDSHSAGHGGNSISGGGAAAQITAGIEEVAMFGQKVARSILYVFLGGDKH